MAKSWLQDHHDKVQGGELFWYGGKVMAKAETELERAVELLGKQLAKNVQVDLGRKAGPTKSAPDRPSSKPGEVPHLRTGILQGSITDNPYRDGHDFVTQVGNKKGPASPYARILELGGPINHPGGTPYWVDDHGAHFISRQKADELLAKGIEVKLTKPHSYRLQARPYLRPALDAMGPAIKKELKAAGGRMK
jgi:hypothetical protein